MAQSETKICPDCNHEGRYHAWPGCTYPQERTLPIGITVKTCGCTGLNWVEDKELKEAMEGLRNSPITKRMEAAAERRKKVALGKVGVDTGMILCIDPCHLFNDKDWHKICEAEDIPEAVQKALVKKFKCNENAPVCFETRHGDGLFPVTRKDDGVMIEGA